MYQTILLPLDLNDEASWKKSLPTALELSQTHGAKLHVMTVVPDFGMAIVVGLELIPAKVRDE